MIAGQDAVARLDDGRFRFESAASQPRVDAEGQFDAAGAATDDDHLRPFACHGLDAPVDRRRQAVDGPRGNRMLADPGEVECGHR